MTIGKKDITIFIVLFLVTISCVGYFYKNMSDEQLVATADPYGLIIPTPKAIFAINHPSVFERMILPMKNIHKVFSDHISSIFLSLIQENPDLSSFLIAYYPQGDILYVPMNNYTAKRIFKQLDASFAFPAQRQEEASIPVRYYPDIDKLFLGCYYHEGIFVASYNRKLLVETMERQQAHPVRIIPELEELINKKGKSSTMNLFLPSAPLDLYTHINDSTEWRMRNQWLAVDLFYSEGNLCCFNEQPYEEISEEVYQNLCDTITNRINQLFPQIKTTAQVSHDEAVAYFTVCGN
ncbi:hypothetical protein [uncultured Parabacteroides sp.]|uniref:hypothetical protein n=1 Tax=uncultured Parabacteroides sp. TaxID=512312 RepID=UPI0026032926|nr:hypothetical protein [uncultured Parabacteroides sp.]